MDPQLITQHYPRLFHMAELGSWPSIVSHGLRSTRALVDLFEVEDPLRGEVLSKRRPASVTLHHPLHGIAVVRDQLPLREGPLRACLTDMTLEEWLETLNSRVFFWLDEARLETLLGAEAYRHQAHDVIQIDTAALLARESSRITLSPINSGSTLYKPQPRGSRTFQPIADYPFEERRRKRGLGNAIVELAVDGGVPDIEEVTLRVERRQAGGTVRDVLLERKP